jgi:uncharacterized membrane protein
MLIICLILKSVQRAKTLHGTQNIHYSGAGANMAAGLITFAGNKESDLTMVKKKAKTLRVNSLPKNKTKTKTWSYRARLPKLSCKISAQTY